LNFKFFFLESWIFLKIFKFYEISEFSLIDDEVQVFGINIKLLSNPVAELKIRENNSHCRSIVLKTMDRSIVKQLEKEKNSNFNVENVVVIKFKNFKFFKNSKNSKKFKIFIKFVVTMHIYVEVYFLKRIKLLWMTGK
jgi:hypothetical protein